MPSKTVVKAVSESNEQPLFDAVGCICIFDNRLLLLRRNDDRSYPGVWGLPSGKVESKETRDQAVIREVYEETGLLRSSANLDHVADFHVTNDEFTFLYGVFSTRFSTQPTVRIDKSEHIEYRWYSFEETSDLALVPGTRECLSTLHVKLFPPAQLSLFGVEDNLLADNLYAEQEQLEAALAHSPLSSNDELESRPIVVIGPPAAGKTTAIRSVVNKRSEVYHHRYDIMKDKSSRQYLYLTRFLGGDRSFAFPCQIEALASRYWHGRAVGPSCTLADEWIYSTLAYSKALRHQGNLQDYEFQTFYMTYMAYLRWLPSPALIVHLTAQPAVLRNRIEARGRKLERFSHDRSYLSLLVRAFEEVSSELSTRFSVVTIDSSNLGRAAAAQQLLELVDDYRPKSS